MPTGYTHNVPDGITFEQFVWQCARGMGALVSMRDCPMDAPIPERFEPSNYYINRLQEARNRLHWLNRMTPEQREAECKAAYERDEARKAEQLEKNERQLAAYQEMLDRVLDWVPPIEEHKGLKQFMAQQLRESIRLDDMRKCYLPSPMFNVDVWHATEVINIRRDIAHYEKENQKEVDRTNARNRWLESLRASVPPADAAFAQQEKCTDA